ncbi:MULTISPECIES: 3'-5' exonuclease, partial [Vibrio]|uniref:3'-5' exonuclease n=1 Tax=Vibrio TaxID=662 RepID=UPI0029641396
MNIQQGFLLTRQARDIKGQTQIELWLATEAGPTQLLINGEKPVFFIAQEHIEQTQNLALSKSIQVEIRTLELKTFEHTPLAACYTKVTKEALVLQDLLSQQDIVTYEGDIRLADRYLMERFIKGSVEFTGHQQSRNGFHRIQNAKCRSGDYEPKLHVVSLDLECSEKGVLYSIGLDSPHDSRVIMIGEPEPAETNIQWVQNEKALLEALIAWFKSFDPDVIVGWNVIDFDFRLLHKRAEWHNMKLMLGRADQPSFFRSSSHSQQGFISIPGRVVLDGID